MALDQTLAFPQENHEDVISGMLLWDYYAAHALMSVCNYEDDPAQSANHAADIADAMMAERARRNTFSKEP